MHFHSNAGKFSAKKLFIITQLVNLTVTGALGAYYQSAAHRIDGAGLIADGSGFQNRPLHFFRGMMHFQPAAPYLNTLRLYGYDPRVVRFPDAGESDLLSHWRRNTSHAVRDFLASPESLGERPVICGHSAGGLTVYALAALAKGGDLNVLREECGFAWASLSSLERLRESLSQGLFAAIASPFQGVKLTRVGRCLNRCLIERGAPMLVTGIMRHNLEKLYRRVGKRPEEVIDANLLSNLGVASLEGGLISRAVSFVIQGGMRVFTPFLDHDTPHDGIVPMDAALLDGPKQAFAPFDHLKLVEKPEAAMALADVIRRSDPFAEKIS